MAHELAGALQQAGRIRQRCAVKEPHVHVRGEYVYVAEGRVSQTCHRTTVMQELPNFVTAFSHYLKPLVRDGSQFTCMLFHPRIDGGISLDSSVESQKFRSQRRSTPGISYGNRIAWPWQASASAAREQSPSAVRNARVGPPALQGTQLPIRDRVSTAWKRYRGGQALHKRFTSIA